jgi:hypothetical protein
MNGDLGSMTPDVKYISHMGMEQKSSGLLLGTQKFMMIR